MKVTACANRQVIAECTLDNFNYQIDPYVGCEHYCYYCYVLAQAETDWTEEVRIHKNLAARLNKELSAIPPQTVYMGWHTDPYQPCEADSRQTRQVLELLLEKGFSASILTKSDLVLRDMDVLQAMSSARVSVSVAFHDNAIRQLFEANTIDTEARINALSRLKQAGITTSSLICPVIPYISEVQPLIEKLAAHAAQIWVYGLSIEDRSSPSWKNIEKILSRSYPDLKSQVEAAIFTRDHPYWKELRQDLSDLKEKRRLNLNIHL